jgi:hypothetical protein
MQIQYVASLEDDPACVTYLAEIPDEFEVVGKPVKVVVKFVTRYGKEVHEFLATKEYAPALRYYYTAIYLVLFLHLLKGPHLIFA